MDEKNWVMVFDDDHRAKGVTTVLDEAAVLAVRNGLWHESPFREELMKYKPQTLEDALHRAITFIEIEEDKAAFSKKHAATKKSSSKDKEPDEYYEPRHHYDKAYRDGKSRKASNYQISDQPSSRSTGKQDRNSQGSEDAHAYCSYHKSKTHNTEECHHLQEWLLNKYHNYRDSSSKNQQNEKPTAHALLNAGSLPTAHALLKS